MRARLPVAVALAAAVLGGCGGSGPAPATQRATTPTAATPATGTRVRISEPAGRAVIRARRDAAGRARARLTVSGTAAPQQVVAVDGHCRARSCTRMAFAGPDGRWTASLTLVLPARTATHTVSADYAVTPAPATRDALRVRVQVPAAPAATTTTTPAARTPEPAGPTTLTGTDAAGGVVLPPAQAGSQGTMVMIGDSLADDMRGELHAALPSWRLAVDARTGRHLAEGMRILSATTLPRGAVLAMSLFTNDDPWRTGELAAAVATTLDRVGPSGCVIWATIAAPPEGRSTYDAANALLERLAAADGRLRVVPWAREMDAHPGLLGPDRTHPTALGYRLRARLYAREAAACG